MMHSSTDPYATPSVCTCPVCKEGFAINDLTRSGLCPHCDAELKARSIWRGFWADYKKNIISPQHWLITFLITINMALAAYLLEALFGVPLMELLPF